MCGENPILHASSAAGSGSSPRVRGKPASPATCTWERGLIPACAGKTGSPSARPGLWAAHPRVCGENITQVSPVMSSKGSSPRVRGKRVHSQKFIKAVRLIPACAGKTPRRRARRRPGGAHPRVCGENMSLGRYPHGGPGSSPRVRGKHLPSALPHRPVRLIPACAGKTRLDAHPSSSRRAHPRVCGENVSPRRAACARTGSSPRVRGKRRRCPAARQRPGLIPACAGKTCSRARAPSRASAHPRVCGENPRTVPANSMIVGSSPRVRGKRSRRPARRRRAGLIPACAGKTKGTISRARSGPAHPRVCGENPAMKQKKPPTYGSSPRVRGKLIEYGESALVIGLIPACAGKTGRPRWSALSRWAHPRVCGENRPGLQSHSVSSGSSPRVRGKHQAVHRVVLVHRLIPAYAGKTSSPTPRSSPGRAHPRVCGENADASPTSRRATGSSPRVRGKLYEGQRCFHLEGSSPRVRGKRHTSHARC